MFSLKLQNSEITTWPSYIWFKKFFSFVYFNITLTRLNCSYCVCKREKKEREWKLSYRVDDTSTGCLWPGVIGKLDRMNRLAPAITMFLPSPKLCRTPPSGSCTGFIGLLWFLNCSFSLCCQCQRATMLKMHYHSI